MEWLFYVTSGIVLALSGVMVGFVVRDKQMGKLQKFMLEYNALTPKSKELVNGYIYSRSVNDERTTYRERR